MSHRPRIRSLPAILPIVISSIVSCATTGEVASDRGATPVPGEGFVEVEGGRVWYQIVGKGTGTPLLVLHGGPAIPHDYLTSLGELGTDRPIVFYDQLGCGRSDRPKDAALWATPRFVKELQQVRDALGLSEVILFGHSWGSLLATEYALTKPQGLKAMVLAGPALNIPQWQTDANAYLTQLPAQEQDTIRRRERGEQVEESVYQAALNVYYQRHVCRLDPWPKSLTDAFAGMNPEVYVALNGPNEFTITGALKDVDLTPRLGELSMPVLFTCGKYDGATPATTRSYAERVSGSEVIVFEQSAHLPNVEEKEAYNAALGEWLRKVDAKPVVSSAHIDRSVE